jgi:3-hydroxyacyl-CoA dehydrogenase
MIMEDTIVLENIRAAHTIRKNNSTTITDLGDGIINLEFHTKMNVIDSDVLEGINEAVTLAEQSYKGLVISNNGKDFSTGADLGIIFKLATQQKFDELNLFVKAFQDTMMRIRYSAIPVVAAPHQRALAAACELCLHADSVVAHAGLQIGLDQFNAGLIPFGGGTKEFTLRLADELQAGDIEVNNFRDRFLTIAQAKVSSSAHEAFQFDYLEKGRDTVVTSPDRLLSEAKKQCLLLAADYAPPLPRKGIRALGKLALGVAYAGANSMYAGNYINRYDMKMSQKLAFVMAGGDLSQPGAVSENYLLGLEREAFISLCKEPKTLAKMQAISAANGK